MAVPDYIVSGRRDPIATVTGVLSNAQATASPGIEATGARRAGISQVRDKPRTTEGCQGCPECEPGSSAGRAF
jgi:hypothetical protein